MTTVCLVRLFTTKLNRMITIKELQLDNETALKLIKLIKKEEPEIWEVLKVELTEALNIQNVSNTEPCRNCNGYEQYIDEKGVLRTGCNEC